MDTIQLLNAWNISAENISPIHRGTMSDAKLILSKEGKFVLRRCPSREAARKEYLVSKALADHGLAPEILLTDAQEPFANSSEGAFNLQVYVDGATPDYWSTDLAKQVLEAIYQIHQLWRFNDPVRDQDHGLKGHLLEDPFSINDSDAIELLNKNFCRSVAKQLLDLDKCRENLIHGDLGLWNILQTDTHITVIDYGSTRYGHSALDYAAAIVSLVEKKKDLTERKEALLTMLRMVCSIEPAIAIDEFSLCIFLWLFRGAYASVKNRKEPSYWLKQIKWYDSCL